MTKPRLILANALPIALMVAFIPLVSNDYQLAGIYALIIAGSFLVHRERREFVIFLFGFCVMTICEYFFISTGVETFSRVSFLGVMPLWLPILWAYAFVAIKRAVRILDL